MGRHTATTVAEPTTPPSAEAPRAIGRHSGAIRQVDAPAAPAIVRADSPRRAAQAALRCAEEAPRVLRHVSPEAVPLSRRAAQAADGAVRAQRRHRPTETRRMPRAVAGTAAALAIVAMTTTTAGAAFLTPTAPGDDTGPATPDTPQENGTASASTPDNQSASGVDEATLTAASNELVRAEFLTTEAVGTLTDDQIAQIEEARARLGAAVTATGEVPVVAAADRAQRTSRDSAREDLSTASADPATDDSATSNSADEGQISADPQEISTLTAELRVLLDGSEPNLALQVAPAPPTAEEIAAERQQNLAAQMDQWADSTSGYSNGKLPESILCSLDFASSARLRCDAAHQLEALNAAYRERFGRDLGITDSYRSYSEQVATKRAKGYLAATPGTSNHGWGQAIDTDIDSYGTAYEWMRENAPAYGWDNPTWARPGGSKHEPWHWEFGTSY